MIARHPGVKMSIRAVNNEQQTGWGNLIGGAPEYRFQIAVHPSGRYRIEAVFNSGTKTYGASQILDLRPDSPQILLTLTPATDIHGTLRLEGKTSPPDRP